MTTQQDIKTASDEYLTASLKGKSYCTIPTDTLSRILATLERLPLTADGVVVSPGMDLHNVNRAIGIVVMAVNTGDFYDPSDLDDYGNLYSTPEAAQAAKGGV